MGNDGERIAALEARMDETDKLIREIKDEQSETRDRERAQVADMRGLTTELAALVAALREHRQDHKDAKSNGFSWSTAIFSLCVIIVMVIQLVITYPAIKYANQVAQANGTYLRADADRSDNN